MVAQGIDVVSSPQPRLKYVCAHEVPAPRNDLRQEGPIDRASESGFSSAMEDSENKLVSEARAREIRDSYLTALRRLNRFQRAAWVFCRDEVLESEEAEHLLGQDLHWRTARAAVKAKHAAEAGTLLVTEAARLLRRKASTIRVDLSEAEKMLRGELSNFSPHSAIAPRRRRTS